MSDGSLDGGGGMNVYVFDAVFDDESDVVCDCVSGGEVYGKALFVGV